MSQENIEIIRRAHEAYERWDWAESVKDFDSEAIAYREVPDGAMFYGPEGLLQMITDWLAGFDDFILTTPQLIDANDHQVIARTRQTAVGAGSGVRIEGEFWFVHTLRDAKIIRVDIVTSKARALDVAGLSEQLAKYRFERRDVPRVAQQGLRFRRAWPHTEGALGLWVASTPDGRRQISVSIWRGPEDLRRFVRTPAHLRVMRDFRPAGNLITNAWTADRFDRALIWRQGLDRLTGRVAGVEHH